jgi:K(+)-stimulated pyrophosphate-energized sodium pump
MILGIALIPVFGIKGILFPLVAGALGLLASIAGTWSVKLRGDEDPMKSLNRGYMNTTILALIGFFLACIFLLRTGDAPRAYLWFFGCGIVGIFASFLFVWITEYYTETRYKPVQRIASACQTGPATTIITGLAVGLECTFWPIIVISGAILSSFWMGTRALAPVLADHGISSHSAGLYGTAVATMGMLSTAGYILAMDTFGPITDNAGGIVEMGLKEEAHGEVRDRTDRLDAVGNTTKALTKGYAVGSAALAAFLLFSAYLDQVWHYVQLRGIDKTYNLVQDDIMRVDIGKPAVFVGGLVGAMLVFVFSALAMKAVSRAAQTVIEEVRRQFAEDPGIMQGTSVPNYGRCVDIVTKGALKAMVAPGLLPVIFPLALGLAIRYAFPGSKTLAAEAVAALLMIATVAGILMALFMNNAGGAWDNAKKFIEEGNYGGKGSEAHKASVVGDTVGDPFKDTAGPSLHVLIKLLATLTLVMAPLFIG